MRTRIDIAESVTVKESRQEYNLWKPIGFWYSVGCDWERWCATEEPDWLKGRFAHEVILDSEKMLYLRTPEDIDLFDEKYKFKDDNIRGWTLDWARVATEYDGIEIAPYQWERRLERHCTWYYSWDCASGCIWRPRGVEVKLIGKVKKEAVK